jgi:hypothetical protein
MKKSKALRIVIDAAENWDNELLSNIIPVHEQDPETKAEAKEYRKDSNKIGKAIALLTAEPQLLTQPEMVGIARSVIDEMYDLPDKEWALGFIQTSDHWRCLTHRDRGVADATEIIYLVHQTGNRLGWTKTETWEEPE